MSLVPGLILVVELDFALPAELDPADGVFARPHHAHVAGRLGEQLWVGHFHRGGNGRDGLYVPEPRRHLQEEVIIVKEGLVEANWDGQAKTGGPGSVIFFAAGATTFLRNAGPTPCTYIVIYYYTPLTPKS